MASRRRPPLRRGRFLNVPPLGMSVPSRGLRAAARGRVLQRRGAFWRGPWVSVVAAAPACPPTCLTRRRIRPASRRGEFFATPWPQVVVPVPAFPPPPLTTRRRAPSRHRAGEFLLVVSVLPVPPALLDARRAPRSPARRGRLFWCPIQPVVPAGPAPWVPDYRQRPRAPQPGRRGRFLAIALVGAAPILTTGVGPRDISASPPGRETDTITGRDTNSNPTGRSLP